MIWIEDDQGMVRFVTAYPKKKQKMINELDEVILRHKVNGIGVPVGSKGVVVMVYKSPGPGYEVEFFDDEGDSNGTFTLEVDDVVPVNR